MTCIAIVDDNIVSQEFMRELFAERGWDTLVLTTDEEVRSGLLAPGTRPPDAVILDLHLVKRDAGLDVLSSLKSNAQTRDVPIILCSGDVWALQSISESVRADVAAVLVKPFEIEEAYQCVEFVLDHGTAQAQTPSDSSKRS